MQLARLRQGDTILWASHQNGKYYPVSGDCFHPGTVAETPLAGEFSLLTPAVPSKIVALGVNYRKHAPELGHELPKEPLLFMKPPSALVNPGDPICIANEENRTDYEAELVVVIGKPCRNIAAADAPAYILGYTCGNDVSDRVLQKLDGQWIRAKGYDTYCPIGPHIVTDISPENLRVQAILNGRVVQDGSTADMITGVCEAVAFISRVMTLNPGDLIMTGTPNGIGPLTAGDSIEIRIAGIGSLVNPVQAAKHE